MNKWKLDIVDIEKINPADLNANEMSEKDFEQLVKNIDVSGGLSTAITCYRKADGRYVIIGGHHRHKACVKLAYKKIPVIYADEKDLEKDEITALQLSHNTLHGEDNKGILKRLFDEIQSVDFKKFAHVDIDDIGKIETFNSSIVPVSEHYTVSLILYKEDIDLLDELMGDIKSELGKSEFVILANQDQDEEMMMSLSKKISHKYKIKSSNVTFTKILQLAKKQLENELDSNDK